MSIELGSEQAGNLAREAYIQSDPPDDGRTANWLPAPTSGGFKLALRLYVPKAEVSEGSWVPPAVERVGEP
jgi:hypothetical protein